MVVGNQNRFQEAGKDVLFISLYPGLMLFQELFKADESEIPLPLDDFFKPERSSHRGQANCDKCILIKCWKLHSQLQKGLFLKEKKTLYSIC